MIKNEIVDNIDLALYLLEIMDQNNKNILLKNMKYIIKFT